MLAATMPPMRRGRSTWWPWLRGVLAVAIVLGVGWQFARLLTRPELWDRPWRVHYGWLCVCLLSYAIGLGTWCGFWLRLLDRVGLHPRASAAYRAYYLSQLGKYVPGKAWALVMRATAMPGVRLGIPAMTAAYETLTTMATGALIAACIIPWMFSGQDSLGAQALGLLALAGLPIIPGIFNWLIARITRPFVDSAEPLPRIPHWSLFEGIAITSIGWVCLGASLLAMIWGLIPEPPQLSLPFAARCVAFNAVSYVAGFLFLPAPGGLGIREVILQQLLAAEFSANHPDPAVAAGMAALVVIVLRLSWTAVDVVLAGIAYFWPIRTGGLACSPS